MKYETILEVTITHEAPDDAAAKADGVSLPTLIAGALDAAMDSFTDRTVDWVSTEKA